MKLQTILFFLALILLILISSCKDDIINPIITIIDGDYELCYEKPYNGHWEIFTNNISGTNPQDISNYADDDEYPEWSPDGKYIVFSRSVPLLGPWVIVYDVQNKTEINLTSEGVGGSQLPKWTPNGKVYFYYPPWGNYDGTYIMNPDGSNKKKILDTTANIYFYNDSYNFVYVIASRGYCKIYKSNIDNTVNEFIADLRQTINNEVVVRDFNPNTKELLITIINSSSNLADKLGLYSIRTNTLNILITENSPFAVAQSFFSRDYTKIAYIEINRATNDEEYLSIYENGTKKRLVKLTGREWFDFNPMHFSYDGKYIAFTKNIFGSSFSWKSYLHVVDVSNGKLQYIDEGIWPSWNPNP